MIQCNISTFKILFNLKPNIIMEKIVEECSRLVLFSIVSLMFPIISLILMIIGRIKNNVHLVFLSALFTIISTFFVASLFLFIVDIKFVLASVISAIIVGAATFICCDMDRQIESEYQWVDDNAKKLVKVYYSLTFLYFLCFL